MTFWGWAALMPRLLHVPAFTPQMGGSRGSMETLRPRSAKIARGVIIKSAVKSATAGLPTVAETGDGDGCEDGRADGCGNGCEGALLLLLALRLLVHTLHFAVHVTMAAGGSFPCQPCWWQRRWAMPPCWSWSTCTCTACTAGGQSEGAQQGSPRRREPNQEPGKAGVAVLGAAAQQPGQAGAAALGAAAQHPGQAVRHSRRACDHNRQPSRAGRARVSPSFEMFNTTGLDLLFALVKVPCTSNTNQ
mmetsp:Transcript_2299/g.6081  ORF Transcript_2299/g.6081 Transcript_2299/m.6081 type:complete len:247 (+) Transcript_2299:1429-2169(+)